MTVKDDKLTVAEMTIEDRIADAFSAAERAAWAPKPDVRTSQWAERSRMLTDSSSEPGPWRNSRTPYLVEIMDSYDDPDVSEITITGPAQSGKTAAVENMVGKTIDIEPVPAMYVIARDEDTAYIADARLGKMFKESPDLARHLTGAACDLKGNTFNFDYMNLYFAAAGSAAGLATKSIGRLFLDETDKYPDNIGGEGSPIKLAKRRGETFSDFKAVYLCTLTDKHGFIYLSYKKSNMCRYHIPCLRCGEYSEPLFGYLNVDDKEERRPDFIRDTNCVHYECPKCKGQMRWNERQAMVERGVWCPEGQSVNKKGKLTGTPLRSKRHSGFWIPCGVSPWKKWSDILAEWFEVNEPEAIAKGDLREFKQQVAMQPWEEIGRKTDADELVKRIGDFSGGTVPNIAQVLLAGCDYHKDDDSHVRIDYTIKAFGHSLRNFDVKAGSVTSFADLENELFYTPMPWSDPEETTEPELVVVMAGIDSSFLPKDVYAWADNWPGRVIPTQGGKPGRMPKVGESKIRADRKKSRRPIKPGTLYTFDPEFFKDMVYGWLTAEPIEGPGSTQFFAEIPDEYLRQLCGEHKVKETDKNGREKWLWKPVKQGRKNHFLDTSVIAAVVAFLLKVQILRPRGSEGKKKKSLAEIQRRKREARE